MTLDQREMRCFKCNTPLQRDPDGTMQHMCNCYPPFSSEISKVRAHRIYFMISNSIDQHKETCIGCQILGRPCIDIIPTIDIQEKWKEKAGIA